MAWANLVRSTSSRAVSSGSKICSKQSGNAAKIRAVIHYKVMLQTQTPPIYMMRVRTSFSGLGVNNSLCNMVNNRSRHDFHSTTIASSSATSVEKAASPPILPMGEDMFETFTDKAKQVIKFAQMETRPFGYKFVGTEMILLGLIGDGIDKFLGESTDIAEMVLFSMNICLKDARKAVKEIFGCSGPPSLSVSVDQIPFRPSALRAFQLALAEAQKLGHNYIGSEHLLLGLLGDEDANLVFGKLGASPVEIRIQVMRMIKERAARVVGDGSSGNEMPTLEEEYGLNLTDEKKSHPFVQGNNKMPTLWDENGAFGENLTELACTKEYWKPVVERKALINALIQILGRRSENNAFLVGEKGVGKSSVLLGLVQRIRDLDVPNFLSKKKVIGLSDERYAHFKYARHNLQDLMEEVKECNDIIIYINDENFNLLEDDIDFFVDIMMPAVARGGVQCVISATPDAYLRMRKYPELGRLFQPINVPSTTVDETIKILKGIKKKLEMIHKVRYTDEALVAAVHMSDQFLRHGFQPVNAMDLMDFTGAFVYKKEIHQVRDQEMGQKMNLLQIKQIIERLPPNITKSDVEDGASEVLRLNVMINQVFGVDKSYYELFEVLADDKAYY